MKTTATPQPITDLLARLNLTLESSEARPGGDDKWPHLAFDCVLKRGSKAVWAGPYRLGIGHVDLNGPTPKRADLPDDERAMLDAMRRRPSAVFTDKRLQAALCARLARFQGVQPKLDDVLYSLLCDGVAYFAALSFEEWCSDFGSNSDSVKAREAYNSCLEAGRCLARRLSREEISELQEAFRDY